MAKKNWSNYVTKHSFALDLEEGVFTWKDPKRIAASLKNSAENSFRRKTAPYQSAMSMLCFYPPSQKILSSVEGMNAKIFCFGRILLRRSAEKIPRVSAWEASYQPHR